MNTAYTTIVYIYPPTGLPYEQINFTMPISNVYYLTGNPNSWSLMAYIYLFLIIFFGAMVIVSFIASVRHYSNLQKKRHNHNYDHDQNHNDNSPLLN